MNGTVVKVEPHKSALGGLDANIMALLAYLITGVLGWIPGVRYFAWAAPLVLFFLEKNSSFIRFHAMQSFILNIISAILAFILRVVVYGALYSSFYTGYYYGSWGAIGAVTLIATLISIAITVVAILAMVKACGYIEFKIPLIGSLAAKFGSKAANINF